MGWIKYPSYELTKSEASFMTRACSFVIRPNLYRILWIERKCYLADTCIERTPNLSITTISHWKMRQPQETRQFVEKCLLPSYVWQPGQLNFLNGIKMGISGVYSRNYGACFIFGLPEENCPGGKTENELASLLSKYLNIHRSMPFKTVPTIIVNVDDNWAGK